MEYMISIKGILHFFWEIGYKKVEYPFNIMITNRRLLCTYHKKIVWYYLLLCAIVSLNTTKISMSFSIFAKKVTDTFAKSLRNLKG